MEERADRTGQLQTYSLVDPCGQDCSVWVDTAISYADCEIKSSVARVASEPKPIERSQARPLPIPCSVASPEYPEDWTYQHGRGCSLPEGVRSPFLKRSFRSSMTPCDLPEAKRREVECRSPDALPKALNSKSLDKAFSCRSPEQMGGGGWERENKSLTGPIMNMLLI
eukprot:TRINITY_DN3834_c0_g1_i2.p1 TRINITY_DN3834_c0_g1~~TRINITY_DN3834_c0_g1_i2.p1  ORF type:complete len:168 (+),score=6.25 TRINITY_DN3834_c0_g1_i2:259-762(+)